MVGLFAISEMLVFLEQVAKDRAGAIKVDTWMPRCPRIWRDALGHGPRGSFIGFVAGVLPGAGASLGSVMAYTLEKQTSDKDGTFGKGDPRGVAAPEAGNNAASGGALIPMLTLGVPGSGTTAVMLAMLISLNVQPGPLLFARQPELVWGLVASLYMANVVLLVLNLPMIGLFTRLMAVPPWALMPIVAMVSFVGVFSICNSAFDLELMVAFGVMGYILRKMNISLVPMVLGLLLGGDMERNLRRAMSISDGDWGALVASPISIGLYILTAGFLALSVWLAMRDAKRDKARVFEA